MIRSGPSTTHPGSGPRTSTTTTRDRDPGHYRSAVEGGEHSFFADLVHAREGDSDAATRLQEHNRALSTTVAGAGIVPPVWLTAEYEALARQGRVLAEMVRHIPITSPAPMTLQRQTTGTDAVLAEQATENTHPGETDAFATTVDVVTPKPTSGIQVVSRQMIDSTNPAADTLIYGDMLAVYNRKVEDKVTAAVVAAAGTAVSPMATEAAFLPRPVRRSIPPRTRSPTARSRSGMRASSRRTWSRCGCPAGAEFSKFRDTPGRGSTRPTRASW